MAKPKYNYGWLLKFILAAILLGVGIYMVFADKVVYLITGVAIIVFSLLRIVPLVKTLKTELLRTINIVEIVHDTLMGAFMLYVALSGKDLANEPVWGGIYKWLLAIFFYLRGLVFFNSVVFLGEKTEIPKFWVHIGCLTLGAIIAVWPNFDYNVVGVFFLLISITGAAYLGYDGYGGYRKYREYSKALNEGKKAAEKPAEEKEVPDPEIKKPEKEPEKVPEKEPEEKETYIN